MKNRKILLAALSLVFFFVGCDNFEKINTNPDKPTDATSDLMATRLLWNIAGPDVAKTMSYDFIRCKYMGWNEGMMQEQYNYFGRTGYNYDILTTGYKMVQKAENTRYEDAYKGLYLYVKAYKFFHLTIKVGDIPYSDALKGEEGVFKPQYDTQKEVFIQLLEDLDAAYQAFESFKKNGGSFQGDIIYQGDPEKWQKAISGLEMKILIHLSKHADDADLQVKDKFKNIVQKQLIMESNADNFQLVYKNQSGMVNPFHHTETKHAPYVLLSDVLIDELKAHEDYRLFYYASPAETYINEGHSAHDWDAFAGVDVTAPYTEMSKLASDGLCSRLNPRYTDTEEAVPFAKMRVSDIYFYMAEAALRGWIPGDASEYYLQAIRHDLEFEKQYMPDNVELHYGRLITSDYIEQYLARTDVQLTGDFESDLEKILMQKFLANFLQVYELDAYYDYRRTGYPVFPINPNTNQNTPTDRIPVRFMYPTGELNNNSEEVTKAIERQFDGNDDVNELIWLLK